jgi:Fic family protein
MTAMCDFANGNTPAFFIHPVVRAIVLHFWLAYDHPFVDGNGRCARALFYWSMLRQDYWLCEFLSIATAIKKAAVKYGIAFLHTETDDNDLTYFLLYHLDVLRKALEDLKAYIARKTQETTRVERLIRATPGFNHRQLALLSHALRHPDARYTVLSHQTSHNITNQTARSDLYRLSRQGLLEKRKYGRTFYFFPAAELADKLARSK